MNRFFIFGYWISFSSSNFKLLHAIFYVFSSHVYRSRLCDSLMHGGRRCGNKSLSDRPLRRICTFVLLYLRIDITCSARTTRIHYHRESCLCSRRSRSCKYVSSLSRMFTRPFTTYRILRIRSIITHESRRVDQSTLKRFAFPFLSSFLKITREINI